MKIITVNINKGGTGKSSISFNLAEWLSLICKKKILLIDGDRSCNLTFSFGNIEGKTIYDVFKTGKTEITEITENLDFIKGSELLTDEDLDLKNKQNNCLQFFMWLGDSAEWLNGYDYIIIDTHNDDSIVTSNFIAAADIVLGVSEPSRNGYRAWIELKAWINELKEKVANPITRESYIIAEPYLIANKIEYIGNNLPNTSKEFLEVAVTDERFLGIIAKKELVAKSLVTDTAIFTQYQEMSEKEKEKHQGFYDNVEQVFQAVIEVLK